MKLFNRGDTDTQTSDENNEGRNQKYLSESLALLKSLDQNTEDPKRIARIKHDIAYYKRELGIVLDPGD